MFNGLNWSFCLAFADSARLVISRRVSNCLVDMHNQRVDQENSETLRKERNSRGGNLFTTLNNLIFYDKC